MLDNARKPEKTDYNVNFSIEIRTRNLTMICKPEYVLKPRDQDSSLQRLEIWYIFLSILRKCSDSDDIANVLHLWCVSPNLVRH